MKVLLAGATGTLGVPLTRALVAAGHEVIGLSRTPGNEGKLRDLGAQPLIADIMDRAALMRAVGELQADAVIHQATALKNLLARHRDMAATNALRARGTANLLDAARALGARRFVVQSMIFGYGYGDWGAKVLCEDDAYGPPGRGRFEQHVAAMRSAERQTFDAEGLEGVALRYGLFYGLGALNGPQKDMLRKRMLPVPKSGGGVLSFIHIEDAAAATVAALERGRPGQAYNIVDDQPVAWGIFLAALAEAMGAPRPFSVPDWMFRSMPYAHAIMNSTLRVSNAKIKRELGWAPAAPNYREGLRRQTASRTTR